MLIFSRRPQKDLLNNYERTAKLFKSRFKQPYSFCGCERSPLAAKVTSALRITGKKATNLDDVLRVLAQAEGREATRSSRGTAALAFATHPCTHNMIYHSRTKRIKRTQKIVHVGHENTLLSPPASWLPLLDPASAYGYSTEQLQEASSTSASSTNQDERVMRPWITR